MTNNVERYRQALTEIQDKQEAERRSRSKYIQSTPIYEQIIELLCSTGANRIRQYYHSNGLPCFKIGGHEISNPYNKISLEDLSYALNYDGFEGWLSRSKEGNYMEVKVPPELAPEAASASKGVTREQFQACIFEIHPVTTDNAIYYAAKKLGLI